jgi:hypothetical protein
VHLPGERWRRFVLGMAVVAGVLALLAWRLPYAGVAVSEGPIHRTNPHSSALDMFKVGDRFTYGLNTVSIEGTGTATIKDVRAVGLDDGVRFLGAQLGGPNRRIGAWQILHTWPPRHPKTDPRPLHTPITSSSADPIEWELFIGLEITEPGRFLIEGWRITYEVNGRTYRHTIPARILICTRHEDGSPRKCPVPDPVRPRARI